MSGYRICSRNIFVCRAVIRNQKKMDEERRGDRRGLGERESAKLCVDVQPEPVGEGAVHCGRRTLPVGKTDSQDTQRSCYSDSTTQPSYREFTGTHLPPQSTPSKEERGESAAPSGLGAGASRPHPCTTHPNPTPLLSATLPPSSILNLQKSPKVLRTCAS